MALADQFAFLSDKVATGGLSAWLVVAASYGHFDPLLPRSQPTVMAMAELAAASPAKLLHELRAALAEAIEQWVPSGPNEDRALHLLTLLARSSGARVAIDALDTKLRIVGATPPSDANRQALVIELIDAMAGIPWQHNAVHALTQLLAQQVLASTYVPHLALQVCRMAPEDWGRCVVSLFRVATMPGSGLVFRKVLVPILRELRPRDLAAWIARLDNPPLLDVLVAALAARPEVLKVRIDEKTDTPYLQDGQKRIVVVPMDDPMAWQQRIVPIIYQASMVALWDIGLPEALRTI